jgi:hypothetical protein
MVKWEHRSRLHSGLVQIDDIPGACSIEFMVISIHLFIPRRFRFLNRVFRLKLIGSRLKGEGTTLRVKQLSR